jgi:hypothetical protein
VELKGIGENRSAHKILVWKHEGKKPLEIYMHTWKNNVKIDHEEICFEVVGWIHLAQGRD